MSDFPRRMGEGGEQEPETTAERELKKLTGEEGDALFNKFFPAERVPVEVQNEKDFDQFFKENEDQSFALDAIAEFQEKAKQEIIYLGSAIFYLERGLKTKKFPRKANFGTMFIFVANEADKLASEQGVIGDPYKVGALGTLRAFIDLQRDGFRQNADILDIIKELNGRLEFLKNEGKKKDVK